MYHSTKQCNLQEIHSSLLISMIDMWSASRDVFKRIFYSLDRNAWPQSAKFPLQHMWGPQQRLHSTESHATESAWSSLPFVSHFWMVLEIGIGYQAKKEAQP